MSEQTTAWQKKHATIVEAAKEVFIAKGYSATSMDAIAAQANVSKVTVYNHFKNKKELFSLIMVAHCRGLAPDQPLIKFDANKPPRAILIKFCHRFIDALIQPNSVALMRRIIAEIDTFPDLAQSMWHEGMPILQSFCQYLTEEEKAGRMQIAEIEIAARQLLGMIKENTVYPIWFGLKPKLNDKHIDQVIEKSVDLFLRFYVTSH